MPPSPHKLKHAIPHQLCAALLILPGMALAQENQQIQETPQTQQAQKPHHWAQYNRFVELAAGKHQQNYREQDLSGQTADGILNSETGNQNDIRATMRWQTDSHWMVQLQANRQSGVTQYNGYLQFDIDSLNPYRARFGNAAIQMTLSARHALNVSDLPALSLAWQAIHMGQLGSYAGSTTYRINTYAQLA